MSKEKKPALLDGHEYTDEEVLLSEIICDEVIPDTGFEKSHEKLGHASQVILNKLETLKQGKKYVVIDGRKTINALLNLGKEKVKARVYPNLPRDIGRYILLVKNLQQNPSPIKEAEAIKRLMDEDHKTLKEISEITGINPSTLSRKLSLLDLPKSIQNSIDKNIMTETLAHKIHGLPKDVQNKIAKEESITGDVVEKYHRAHLNAQLEFGDLDLPKKEKGEVKIKSYSMKLDKKEEKVTRKELISRIDEIVAGLKKDQELIITRL